LVKTLSCLSIWREENCQPKKSLKENPFQFTKVAQSDLTLSSKNMAILSESAMMTSLSTQWTIGHYFFILSLLAAMSSHQCLQPLLLVQHPYLVQLFRQSPAIKHQTCISNANIWQRYIYTHTAYFKAISPGTPRSALFSIKRGYWSKQRIFTKLHALDVSPHSVFQFYNSVLTP